MIGQTVSHYRILEKLGEGGMGVVYKAEDTKLKRTVALKFLPPELTRDKDAKIRFIHEAQAASALQHNNICTIHEIDETDDGHMFIAMDCYEGETLKEKIARGPFPVGDAINLAIQISEGLAKAHGAGMVHRDIKPANIMIMNDGVVKILDFGLAKLAGMTKVTKTGMTVGTVAYMSPEQATGGEVDERSDIFSLGSVLYELLTGRAPFEADHEAAELYRILSEHPEPIEHYCEHCPEGLQRVVDRSLQKESDKRYQTVTELEEDLRGILQGIMPAAKRSRRRSRAMIWLIALAVALIALAASPVLQTIRTWLGTPGEVGALHVAVLPFENVAGDQESQVFCDGMMETLTSKLTQLEQFYGSLWVVPASEVRKSGIASVVEAAGTFGVNLAITGSIQPISDGIRLTMNLVSVASKTPRQLRSSVTDIRKVDIALLQDQTVRELTGMLKVELAPPAQAALAASNTDVWQAYDAYVRACGYLYRSDKVGNIDLAIDGFTRATEQDPSYALAYAKLAYAYWLKYSQTRDKIWIPLAMENCDRAVELNEELAPVHTSIGTVYEGTGRYEEAEEHFRRAIDLDPANVDAYSGLASCFAHSDRLDEAEATYRKIIDMKPDFWIAYNNLGLFYYRYGRYEEAMGNFREVARLTPDNVWAYLNLGAALYYLERWEDAAEMFRRAIDITPSRAAYNNLASLEYIQGNYTEAARVYLKAIAIDDARHGTWANLGNSYYWAPGERDKAKEAYRRALVLAEERRKVNPRDAKILANIASYLAMLDDARGAHERLEEALVIDSEDVFVVYVAAHTYEQLGERDKALGWLEKAIEKGYPVKEITKDPFMKELQKDPGFIELLEGRGE